MLQFIDMDGISKQVVGEKIKTIRIRHNKSQEDLGKFLSKSHAAISDIERGKTDLSVSDLSKIAEYFDMTVSQILNEQIQAPFSGRSFAHHRADTGISQEDREKIQKARKEFYKQAREQK